MSQWVFGYGSLIWKVDFPYKRKVLGYIKGFKRRFWWHSLDHRGVPGSPGRVVNLFKSEDNEEKVWGLAYEIDEESCVDTMKKLDHREKGGYSQHTVQFFPSQPDALKSLPVVVYVGEETHPQYAGPAKIEDMAHTICYSVGPSGPNIDYLYNLADALRELGIEDDHIFELEAAVKNINQPIVNI